MPQTKKVQDYWEKRDKVGGAAAPPRFVWAKKVEKDLQEGKSVKEFTAKAEQHKHIERMVSSRGMGLASPCAVKFADTVASGNAGMHHVCSAFSPSWSRLVSTEYHQALPQLWAMQCCMHS